MPQTAKRIIFIGRVHGVGFRFTALHTASRLGLTGTVRNVFDGSVEMVVQGPADDIDHCIRDLENSFHGYITETKIEDIPPNPQHTDFKITF